jgi:putative membrane protein
MAGANKESIDAPYRLKLALDRTMLAWVRTAIALSSFGFALAAFFRALRVISPGEQSTRLHEGAVRFGTALIALGLFAIIGSGVGHWRALRMLQRGQALKLRQWPLSLTLGFLVAALGMVGLWLVLHR